jgi:hypothetical protein
MRRSSIHTTSTIEQPVSSLDSVVYSVRASIVVYLPQTKADLGHLVAIVQCNVWSFDSHGCEEVAVRKGELGGGCNDLGYAGAKGREERASGTGNRSERARSINTRTAKPLGNHVLEVFLPSDHKVPWRLPSIYAALEARLI